MGRKVGRRGKGGARSVWCPLSDSGAVQSQASTERVSTWAFASSRSAWKFPLSKRFGRVASIPARVLARMSSSCPLRQCWLLDCRSIDGISDGLSHRSMGYSIGRVDAPPPGHSVPVTMPPGPPALWLAPGDTRMSLMLRANPESPHGVSLLLCGVTAVVGIVDINHR